MINAYIVTLFNIPDSMKSAERCRRTALAHDVDAIMYKAHYKTTARDAMNRRSLSLSKYNTSYSNVEAVIGNFITQYDIWQSIRTTNEPAIVLEHDAIFVKDVPELMGDIVNLGKPSFGEYNKKDKPGVYPLFSKPGFLPGAHGYYVTPRGADMLINTAQKLGVTPCDKFINTKHFPTLMECYPWPIDVVDTFTTIQKKKGCMDKLQYNKEYVIL